MLNLFDGEMGTPETINFIEEQLQLGMWVLDLRTGTMQWSRGLSRLLGLSAEVRTTTFASFVEKMHPEDRGRVLPLIQIIENCTPFGHSFRIIRTNGTARWIDSRAEVLLNRHGKAERAIGVMLDVTEDKEANRELEIASERYHGLIAAMRGHVFVINSSGMAYDHPDLFKVRGEPPNKLAGRGWLDIVHPADRDATADIFEKSISTSTRYERLHRVRQSNGRYSWCISRGLPIRDQAGAVKDWVGLTIDIQDYVAPNSKSAVTITGAQLRAARGLLRWSVRELEVASGISFATIRRLEASDGACDLPQQGMDQLHRALVAAGIEFVERVIGPTTVCLRAPAESVEIAIVPA